MDDIKQDLRLASNFLKHKYINHIIIGSSEDNIERPTILWNLEYCGIAGKIYLVNAIGELLTQLGVESKIKTRDTVVYCNYENRAPLRIFS